MTSGPAAGRGGGVEEADGRAEEAVRDPRRGGAQEVRGAHARVPRGESHFQWGYHAGGGDARHELGRGLRLSLGKAAW